MIMESPEPSKNNACSSASTINALTNTDSPQVQESPFFRFVNNLSPIKQPVKACHVTQGFVGLSSPPLVFTSPRISCHRETQFLGRPPCTQSPSGEISQSDNRGKSRIEAPGDSRNSTAQLPQPGKFITDTQKDFDIKIDANAQQCSPPPSVEVDEYLADPVDIDQMYSVNPDLKQSNDAEVSLSDITQSKKSISETDSKDGAGDKADEPLLLLEESNKVQKKPAHVVEPGQIEGENKDVEWENKDVEWASQECTKLESNTSADDFAKHHNFDSLAQCAGNEQRDQNDCKPRLMPEQTMQDLKECEDSDEIVSASHAGAENISQDASEASLKHHGLRRRCLQFEEAELNALGSNKSHMNSNATSSKRKMVKLSEPVTSLFPQRSSGNLPATCSKPSGIGLHLNSIVNAMPPGCVAATGMRSSDGLQGMKTTSSISLHKLENTKRCFISSNMDGQSSIDIGNESHANDASSAAGSFISESPSLPEPIALCPESLHDRRKLCSIEDENPEEFKPPSPSKKKKRTSNNSDDNGCKRCNCKKSKCLKLYCDCFAAGIYCADPCSCQGCLNRPEYEDKVLETRAQIESRNPIAFLPKIVSHTTDLPSNNMEDTNLMTPSSARHKRGCNCKRSMCLKKYCECYQANVGCSSGCRCEGCKNVYGTKEEYVARDHAFNKDRFSSRVEDGSDSAFLNKHEMAASKTDLYDLQRLSPITPSLQCSDQGKEAAKSRLLSGKHLPSSESDVNRIPSLSKHTKSLENSHNSLANLETNEILGTDSHEWQVDGSNVDITDQSSPCNSISNILQVTPLSDPESISSSLFTSNTKEWTNGPQSRSRSQGFIRQISGSSLRWLNSPNTPRTRLVEKQCLQSLESESRLFDILEDETPDILKEGSTPTKPMKANSPNQKRVSPPHSHLRGLGSSSSGGFRSGRKFILKSVPSFPPLTPCVDSKGNSSNEDLGNSGSK